MGKKIYTADDIKIIKPRDDFSSLVDISREAFEKNVISSAKYAAEFARTLVVNVLPDNIRYVIYLGASYDGNPLEDNESTYPDDDKNGERSFIDSSSVTDLLWREGKVPEWIDVAVESEDGEYTSVKLECCGRFTDDIKHIYHAHEGRAPFHVLGPLMPPEYEPGEEGGKYDLYWDKTS